MIFDNLKLGAATLIAVAAIGGGTIWVFHTPEPQSPPAVPGEPAPSATDGGQKNGTPSATDAVKAAASVAFPARFRVDVSGILGKDGFRRGDDGKPLKLEGKGAFICDLTRNAERSCTSPDFVRDTVISSVSITRFAHDPARVSIWTVEGKKDGVTWSDLSRGVSVGRTKLVASAGG